MSFFLHLSLTFNNYVYLCPRCTSLTDRCTFLCNNPTFLTRYGLCRSSLISSLFCFLIDWYTAFYVLSQNIAFLVPAVCPCSSGGTSIIVLTRHGERICATNPQCLCNAAIEKYRPGLVFCVFHRNSRHCNRNEMPGRYFCFQIHKLSVL